MAGVVIDPNSPIYADLTSVQAALTKILANEAIIEAADQETLQAVQNAQTQLAGMLSAISAGEENDTQAILAALAKTQSSIEAYLKRIFYLLNTIIPNTLQFSQE